MLCVCLNLAKVFITFILLLKIFSHLIQLWYLRKTKKSKKLAALPIKSKMHCDDDVGNEDDWDDFNTISEVNIQS